MSFSYLKNFVLAGGRQSVEKLTTALVIAAPDLATEAELATLEEQLDETGRVITRLQSDLTREQHEYDAINSQYGQLMAAAEIMQGKIDDQNTSDEKRAGLSTSLAGLLVKIEGLAPRLDQESQEVADVKRFLSEAEAAYNEKTTALIGARETLIRAKNEMGNATIQEERAARRAEDARAVAGLRSSSSNGINIALESMKSATETARQHAAAHNLKANALTASKTAGEEDANVRDALAQVKGESNQSLSERLSSLRR
jgi:chromosome segregation ATPase